MQNDYVCHSSLRERGWTDAMIRDYELEPDKTVSNPHYKCAGDMKLYKIERLEKIESEEWFKKRYEQSRKRSASARKAAREVADRKFKETMDFIDSIEIKMPNWSKEVMFENAIEHYNMLWRYRGKDKYIYDYRDLDTETLERLTANFVRHGLTDYDYVLSQLFNCVGVSAAHSILQERINTLVHEKYFAN